jgi:membrane protein
MDQLIEHKIPSMVAGFILLIVGIYLLLVSELSTATIRVMSIMFILGSQLLVLDAANIIFQAHVKDSILVRGVLFAFIGLFLLLFASFISPTFIDGLFIVSFIYLAVLNIWVSVQKGIHTGIYRWLIIFLAAVVIILSFYTLCLFWIQHIPQSHLAPSLAWELSLIGLMQILEAMMLC